MWDSATAAQDSDQTRCPIKSVPNLGLPPYAFSGKVRARQRVTLPASCLASGAREQFVEAAIASNQGDYVTAREIFEKSRTVSGTAEVGLGDLAFVKAGRRRNSAGSNSARSIRSKKASTERRQRCDPARKPEFELKRVATDSRCRLGTGGYCCGSALPDRGKKRAAQSSGRMDARRSFHCFDSESRGWPSVFYPERHVPWHCAGSLPSETKAFRNATQRPPRHENRSVRAHPFALPSRAQHRDAYRRG